MMGNGMMGNGMGYHSGGRHGGGHGGHGGGAVFQLQLCLQAPGDASTPRSDTPDTLQA